MAVRAHNSLPTMQLHSTDGHMGSTVSGCNRIPHQITTTSIIQLLVAYRRPDGRARDEHRRYFPFSALDPALHTDLPHRLNDVGFFSTVTNLTLLWEGFPSGSDGWDGSPLFNNTERLRGTATNFSVCRCLLINKYRDITWEADPRRAVGTTNTG